jgi:hypothetical protein
MSHNCVTDSPNNYRYFKTSIDSFTRNCIIE